MPSPAGPRAVVTTRHGEMEIEFLADKAPGHVKNFVDLARKGFYDGSTFHRVIPGFMIQGGDPNTGTAPPAAASTARAGPATRSSRVQRRRPQARRRLQARAQDPNSAGSQFFICVEDSAFLDRQYTAFGRVVRGMEVADKIVSEPRDGATTRTSAWR
jgi:peptidyl-prolyl cis-trans isomerase B (cyclophilin B)